MAAGQSAVFLATWFMNSWWPLNCSNPPNSTSSCFSIDVTKHQHFILSSIYKVKFVSSLIFAFLSSGFHVLFFPLPSQKALLISDPQLTTLLQRLCFAVLKSRICTQTFHCCPGELLPQLRKKWHGLPKPIVLHLSVGFHLSHEFHMKFGVLRSSADPFGHKCPVWPNYIVALEEKRKWTIFAFCSFADP